MLKVSAKYKPLLLLPDARDKVKSPELKKLTPQKQEFWLKLSKVRTVIVTGGRGSGKSFIVECGVLNASEKYGHKHYYTRYTNDSLYDTVISDFEKAIEVTGIDSGIVQKNRIDFENGGEIVFRGLKRGSKQQTAGGKGISKFNCQIVEEAEEHPSLEEFEKMQLSLRNKDFQNYSILILNPTTKEHWIYKEFFEDRGVTGGFNGIKDEVLYIHTTYLDVPKEHHTEENWQIYQSCKMAYEEYEALNPEDQAIAPSRIKKLHSKYKHEIMGGWLDKAQGVVFKDWECGDFPKELPYIYGLDFGYSPDPCALVKVAVDNSRKRLYIEEKLYAPELSTDQIENWLNRLTERNDLIVGDCAEKRLINELRQRGINIVPSVKGADSIRKGIKDMLNYDLVVCGDSVNLKRELNNYCFNDKRSGVPIDEYNHLIDGCRYGLNRLINGFHVG